MAYRDDLDALAARHDALTAEVEQKTRERDDTRGLLEQARARARLPVLDNLRVAAPCKADWNAMTGDDRARHCGDCQKTVYNISGLTRDEAEALLVEKNGELCVRYYQRADGTILLADCEVGVKRRRRKHRWIAAGAALLASGAGAVTYRALRRERRDDTIMGAIAAEAHIEITDIQAVPPPHDLRMGQAIALPVMGGMAPSSIDPKPTTPTHKKR